MWWTIEYWRIYIIKQSPGIDGLTAEFYKHFWNFIKNTVLDSLNESHEHEEMVL